MDPERWRRVRHAVEDALELEPAARPAFLARACPDPDERREVESLLASHDRDPSFLEEGAGPAATALLRHHTTFAPGRTLGAYRVEHEIGRGGMGVVYLATDTRLGRPVAIKVLSEPQGADSGRRERLRREARAAAAVSHPGVAQVHALEEDPAGFSFVVTEFVDGHTLRDEIALGPLPIARAIETARQIAHAIAAAHARGVVHRDLKPENVMRARDGSIKVLDFGLARLEQEAGDTRLTRPGFLMGTPGYMAPEQLLGQDATAESDVYALGLLLYELLTGRHPFSGSRDSPASLIARVLEGAPDPLPADIARARPGLEDLLRRCLARRPDERLLSMAALAAALDRLAAANGESAAAPPAVARAAGVRSSTGWWQLHQVVISVLFIVMIYPAWLNRGVPLPGWAHTTVFLGIILAAAFASTLRWHLVFTARVHPSRLTVARGRAGSWIRAADVTMTLALLAAGGAAILRDRVWFAALFFTVAASTTVAAILIEPATTEATFGEEP